MLVGFAGGTGGRAGCASRTAPWTTLLGSIGGLRSIIIRVCLSKQTHWMHRDLDQCRRHPGGAVFHCKHRCRVCCEPAWHRQPAVSCCRHKATNSTPEGLHVKMFQMSLCTWSATRAIMLQSVPIRWPVHV